MVMNAAPIKPAKIVYGLEHTFPFVPAAPGRIETGGNEIRNMKIAAALHDFVPAAGNRGVKQAKRDQRAPDHNRRLNQIGPNDGLDSTERGVDRGENDDCDRGTEVDPERLGLVGPRPADHLIGQGESDGCDVKPRPGREQTRDHENSGSRILAPDPEARGQVFVNRKNFVVVIRFDENVADENASYDRTEGELQVAVIAMAESFPGRSEKCAGTCFSRDERRKDRPPWDAPATEGKVGQGIFLPAHAQADADDEHEVEEQDSGVDEKARVHGELGDRKGGGAQRGFS